MDNENKQTVICIRHAESEYNYQQKQYAGQMNVRDVIPKDESLELKYNYDLMDASVCERGLKECQLASEKIKELNIGIVISSPLRRCLQTSNILFKNHPNHPRIIAEPLLREVLLSNCDVGGRFEESMKDFPNIDFSRMLMNENVRKAPNMWSVESFYNDVKGFKQFVKQKLEADKQLDYNRDGPKLLIDFIKSLQPECLELREDTVKRIEELKKVIDEYQKELKGDQKLAVVTHSATLLYIDAKEVDKEFKPVGYRRWHNCEALEVVF